MISRQLRSICSTSKRSFSFYNNRNIFHSSPLSTFQQDLFSSDSNGIINNEITTGVNYFIERNFHRTFISLESGRRKYIPDGFERMPYEEKMEVIRKIMVDLKFKNAELDIFKKELDEMFLYGSLVGENQLYGEIIGIFLSTKYFIHIRALVALLLILFILSFYRKQPLKKNWKAFVYHLRMNEVKKITIHPDGVEITLISSQNEPKRIYKKKRNTSFILPLTGPEFEKRLRLVEEELNLESLAIKSKQKKSYEVFYNPANIRNLESLVITYLSIAVTVVGLGYLFTRGAPAILGGVQGGGGTGPRDILNHQFEQLYNSNVKFEDVAGLKQQKVEIMEFVEFLEQFGDFQEIGCELPRGCMLVGPPGCGKTLLAKSVAGECGMPFFSAVGSEFVEMFVGIGPQRVRELFAEARAAQPSIIFIDEIDAVGGKRGSGQFLGRNDERENTLNQLLIEMDGFSKNENVLVMGATNRLEILDPALLRAGRFDRQITIPLPDVNERQELFELYMKEVTMDFDEGGPLSRKAHILASLCPGCSGADIQNICNEAAIIATRKDADFVGMKHFQEAIDKVIAGFERRTKVLSDEERKIVASHEAGHALIGWLLDHGDPVLKATIIPRSSGALGFTQHFPSESWVRSKAELEANMCMLLGGRAAEELCFQYGFSDGASSDLKRVTGLARSMTHQWGMFPKKIGHISFNENPHILEITKPYSDTTENIIDDEMENFINNMYQKTLDLIKENMNILESIVEALLEKETIDAMDLKKIIGFDPRGSTKEFEEYLKNYEEVVNDIVEEEEVAIV